MKKSILIILATLAYVLLPAKFVLAAQGDVFRVTGVAPGEGISMYQEPNTKSPVIIKLPHNASWVIKRAETRPGWQRISWNDQSGWIEAGKLVFDRAATQVVAVRNQCLKDPTVTNKICCGFPPSAEPKNFKAVKIHSVTGIAKGDALKMYTEPKKGAKVVVLMPHNATWIVKLGKKVNKDGIDWEKVTWGGNTGWVNSVNLQFNPELTIASELKRKACALPAGCAPDLSGVKE